MTRGEFEHFRSTIDMSRSRTRRIQIIIFNFVKKSFFVSAFIKIVAVKLHVSRLGLH